jgi:hypothetical protein
MGNPVTILAASNSIKFVNGLRQVAGFLRVLNKTDRQSITEMF